MLALGEVAYYEKKFTRDPLWSSREPNSDEAARWLAIESILSVLPADNSRRLLDVGCGRGWMTALAARYGMAQGLEPVAAVVAFARRSYPECSFDTTSLSDLLVNETFRPFDVVLCSEVIEHIDRSLQPLFAKSLAAALAPEGWLILTTPRRDMFERWQWLRRLLPERLRGEPDQPVEELLTEQEMGSLLQGSGLRVQFRKRAYVKFSALSPANALLGNFWVAALLRLKWMEPLRALCHQRWAVYQVWGAQRMP